MMRRFTSLCGAVIEVVSGLFRSAPLLDYSPILKEWKKGINEVYMREKHKVLPECGQVGLKELISTRIAVLNIVKQTIDECLDEGLDPKVNEDTVDMRIWTRLRKENKEALNISGYVNSLWQYYSMQD